MKNPKPESINGLLISMVLAIQGATLNPAITLLRYPLMLLTAIRLAAVMARDTYENNKQQLPGLRGVVNTARMQARAFAILARDVLKPIFGGQYSEIWDATGYVGSLETPTNVNELCILLEALVAFFTANPAYEVAGRVTAAKAQELLTTLSNARQALSDQETKVDNLLALRNQKLDVVRKAIGGLFHELNDILDPIDPRWKQFGFNPPGAEETPEVPENLIATLIGPTVSAVKWNASARAGHYRVWMKIHGADGDYVAVGSPEDLDFTIENLPANSTIDIVVSAVNAGGESAFSNVVTVTTH
jgi:hypothetical protein